MVQDSDAGRVLNIVQAGRKLPWLGCGQQGEVYNRDYEMNLMFFLIASLEYVSQEASAMAL